MRRGPALAAGLAAVALLAACTPSQVDPSPSASAPVPPAVESDEPAPVASAPAPAALAWGPLESEWDDALATARALPVRVAAGQVMVADLYSPDADAAAALVREHHLGGVILMGGSAPSADAVTGLADAVAAADRRAWPVWISVDEEGGVVSRLADALPSLPGFMAAGAATDKDAVTAAYASTAADLRGLGVTVNFAPVADVTIGPSDPVIRTRSAGSDPAGVADTVLAAVEGYLAGGAVPVVKHFPGHGSVTVDSHADLPVQDAPLDELARTDLVPFARAIDAGAPAVMLGHIAVPEWGDGPASLEPEAYAYLREDLGFTGVAVTDALNMGAVTQGRSAGEVAVEALVAGADVLVMPADLGAAIDGVVAAVASGDLPRERLVEAAARSILLMRWSDGLAIGEPDVRYGRTFAAAGTTVATADCGSPLVGRKASIVAGPDDARRDLTRLLEEEGVAVGDRGTSIALIPSGATRASADVVVSLGDPWGLFESEAEAYVATFGGSRVTLAGLADVLVGDASPGGTWPVDMGDEPFPACAG